MILSASGHGAPLPSNGAAFYIDPLVNVNGSLDHSPGARAAAAMTALPYSGGVSNGPDNTDVILFGGLTAVNRSEAFPSGERCTHHLTNQYLASPVKGVAKTAFLCIAGASYSFIECFACRLAIAHQRHPLPAVHPCPTGGQCARPPNTTL